MELLANVSKHLPLVGVRLGFEIGDGVLVPCDRIFNRLRLFGDFLRCLGVLGRELPLCLFCIIFDTWTLNKESSRCRRN